MRLSFPAHCRSQAGIDTSTLKSCPLRRFDETGNPTHAADGAALEPKAASKAAKEADKLRKARGPLDKKLAEDPAFLDKLRQEMSDLEIEVTQAEQ